MSDPRVRVEIRAHVPTHGWTKLGHAVHARTVDHLPAESRKARFDKAVAEWVTSRVGTMNCAYLFGVLALLSLPAVLSAFAVFHGVFPGWLIKASVIALVAWVAQTFLQLVLLSVIIVGQNIQSQASDARAAKTFEDTEKLLSLMDTHTAGGLTDIVEAVNRLTDTLAVPDPPTK